MNSNLARASGCIPSSPTCSTPPAVRGCNEATSSIKTTSVGGAIMSRVNRRDFLKTAAGAAAGATIVGGAGAGVVGLGSEAEAAPAEVWKNQPEKGAKLRVLRWKRFVEGEDVAYMANVKKFTEKTGIEVR